MKIDLKKYQIISFDIFDTLVYRNTNNPMQVFELVENKYNKINKKKIEKFKEYRLKAECECRKNTDKEEVTLEDIYSLLNDKYDKKQIKELQSLEKQVEITICNPNPEMFKLFQKALKINRVIITTDMYLDRETIESILKKCGYYGYEKLYISSEVGKTKRTGNIFKYINKDLKLQNENILHIGDNKISDYLNPKLSGWKSKLIKRNKSEKKGKKITNEDLFENFLKYSKHDKDYFYNFGYFYLGPLFYFFTIWLLKRIEKNNIKTIFFLSRDGYILKKAFDIINNQKDINSRYFYASRRATIVPSLKDCNDLDDILNSIHWPKIITLNELLKKVGLDDINIDKYLIKYNLVKEMNINITNIKNQDVYEFLQEIYPMIIENSKQEYYEFQRYKEQEKFNGKIGIVDIGWYGNMQKALEKLSNDLEIYGYYVGLTPSGENQNFYKMEGFLFDKKHGKEIYEVEKSINSLFELFFTAPHGSVKRYNMSKKEYVELYEYEYKDNTYCKNIFKMQEAALEFIKDFKDLGLFFDIDIPEEKVVEKIFKIAKKPSCKDAKKLGDLIFLDNGINYIAKPKKLLKYAFKPKKFIIELKRSAWKVGFLKRAFKVKIPYYKLYKKFANI